MKWMTIFFLFISFNLHAVEDLKNGPMLGAGKMKGVSIWLQTKVSATVYLKYRKLGTSKYSSSEKITTEKKTAFVAQFDLSLLEPNTTYEYEIYQNRKKLKHDFPLTFTTQKLWQWRTDPPDFSLAIGSCLFINEKKYDRPGNTYGGEYFILDSIADKKPNLMLWLGDNVYFREVEYDSKAGMFHRYTHSRDIPEMKRLLRTVHNYAIWDDHDYGPNDTDKSYVHKNDALEAFKLFWANPNYAQGQKNAGIYGQFQWSDIDFFLLDDRYYRDANGIEHREKDYFGKKQIDWLINALKRSQAPFKVIASGGQVLSPAKVYENYANYEKERSKLLSILEKEKISGVVFLSGDRHHTVITKIPRGKKSYPLYDITVSPLTSGSFPLRKSEQHSYQIKKTIVSERNFAILSFSGERENRVLHIADYNSKGEKLWDYKITASELSYK